MFTFNHMAQNFNSMFCNNINYSKKRIKKKKQQQIDLNIVFYHYSHENIFN